SGLSPVVWPVYYIGHAPNVKAKVGRRYGRCSTDAYRWRCGGGHEEGIRRAKAAAIPAGVTRLVEAGGQARSEAEPRCRRHSHRPGKPKHDHQLGAAARPRGARGGVQVMGVRASRKTVTRRTPLQATLKRIGDLARYAARVYAQHDPPLSRKWRALARRCDRL